MPSTYLALNVHIIFSTKNRVPFLKAEVRERIHSYLGGVIRNTGATAIEVGGVDDHLHLLVGLKSTQSVSSFVKEIKLVSGDWIRTEMSISGFSWQEGYAAIAVSPERVDGVRRYIQRQEEHHQSKSALDELAELLTFSGIEFDQRYLD